MTHVMSKKKQARFMKEYLLSDRYADLANYNDRWTETWILHPYRDF